MHTDPRFRRMPKAKTQVKVDERFAGMFHDPRFSAGGAPGAMDKRGRAAAPGVADKDLRRYYRLAEAERPSEEAVQAQAQLAAEEKEAARRWAKLRGLGSESDSDSDSDSTSGSTSDTDVQVDGDHHDAHDRSDDDIDKAIMKKKEKEKKKKKDMKDLEEGDDESSGAGEDMDEAEMEERLGGREMWGVGWDAIHPSAEAIPDSDVTPRFALVDLDWSRIRAVDLYAVLSSFVPSGGKLLHVAVYLSDYGKERIEAEQRLGPAGIFGPKTIRAALDADLKKTDEKQTQMAAAARLSDEDDDDENGHESNDDDDDGDDERDEDENAVSKEDASVHQERVRAYERAKLRWYYGVATFDSAATASHCYEECDGMDYELSGQVFDLRFVPEDESFANRDVRDEARSIPPGYSPPEMRQNFNQAHMKLSWDEDDYTRKKVLSQRLTADEIREDDFRAYLASSSEESSSSSDDDEPAEKQEKPGKKSTTEQYKALLLGDGDTPRGGKARMAAWATQSDWSKAGRGQEDGPGDMTVTFTAGLDQLGARLLEKKKHGGKAKEETVWDAYLKKKAEKKKERRRKNKMGATGDDSDADTDGGDSEGEDQHVRDGLSLSDDHDDGEDDFFVADDAKETKCIKETKEKARGKEKHQKSEKEMGRRLGQKDDPFDDPFFRDGPRSSDGADPFDDPFFEEGHDDQQKETDKKKKKKKEKTKKELPSGPHESEVEVARRRAELEMILMDDRSLRDAAAGRGVLPTSISSRSKKGTKDMEDEVGPGLTRKEKIRAKKEAKRNKRLAEDSDDEDAGDFQVNLNDPRFARLFTSHDFALDPTDPRFKTQDGAAAIAAERAKRVPRSGRRSHGGGGAAGPGAPGASSEEKRKAAEKLELNAMVAKLKAKKKAKH